MNSTVFKYKHHYQQQQQHQPFSRKSNNKNQTSNINNNNNGNNCGISSHNNNNNNNKNNNQNSIFILNTAANNILPNNHELYYSDLNENNVAPSAASSCLSATTNSAAPSSVWSSASSTMCSPAAHALQKLFNCSSSSSFKFNNNFTSGIESKTFLKSKSEILKKKSKFWKYLQDEDNDKNNQKGIEDTEESGKKLLAKGLKFKSCNSPQSLGSSDHNQEDLCELLEYSCSLCDNCRCVDCEIGYFDCENSDDSNSEYSFHLSAYEEDEEADNSDKDTELERQEDLKSPPGESLYCLQTACENCCTPNDGRKLNINFESPSSCCAASCCVNKQQNCTNNECCQQCFIAELDVAARDEANRPIFITTKDH